MANLWTPEEIVALSDKFRIRAGCQLHRQAEDYHFPRRSFLQDGYAPPGGYVKDFSIVRHEGRWHLFHIDGRPGEVCWITGNEISFGHASTSDFCHWIRHPMPLAVGERPWESEHVWAPYIHRRNGRFHLFYMGNGHGKTFISYATSSDLERWTRWPDGPISCAVGRDPFVYTKHDSSVLIYTCNDSPSVGACASRDMNSWQALPPVLTIPSSKALESPSLHPYQDGFVLWFNDCGDDWLPFRAAYALSDDPLHFAAGAIQEFEFQTDRTDVIPSPELAASQPIPLSIELMACGEKSWLVAYFRWHGDRNRLFFGEIIWSVHPAVIREISDPVFLEDRLRKYVFS